MCSPDHAKYQHTFEQADHRVTSRTTVQPQCNRVTVRVASRLEEPKEGVNIFRKVNESGIAVHSRRSFANTILSRFLVGDIEAIGRDDGLDSSRLGRQLSRVQWELLNRLSSSVWSGPRRGSENREGGSHCKVSSSGGTHLHGECRVT